MSEKKSKKQKEKEKFDNLKKDLEMDEHVIKLDELVSRLSINLKTGLTAAEHKIRLERDGLNQLSPPPTTPEWIKFLQQLSGPFAILLWIGAILSFVGYSLNPAIPDNLYIGVVLTAVVLITGIFSYLQERKSANVMAKFADFLPTYALVIRDGEESKIDVKQLVVGDVCKVKAGDKIPADLRLFEVNEMKVDNASLTGEAEPQSRGTECSDENPMETKNLAFYGTLVTAGSATGIVVFTGDDTIIGRIAGLASTTSGEDTPIHKEIHHFIMIITSVAIFLGVSFFIIGMVLGSAWITSLIFMIGIIVANVPEGLLATVTVSLTLTANRMATKHVLVKNLEAVETLGSTTTICSDKTGTLTQNKMTAAHVWYDDSIQDCPTTVTTASYDVNAPSFNALRRICALCCNAVFDPTTLSAPIPERKTIGDASESALIKLVELSGEGIGKTRDENKLLYEIPFNSTNKFHVMIRLLKDGRVVLLMKGAPERVFTRCNKIMLKGKEVAIDKTIENGFQHAYDTLGGMGERVLGFAHCVLDPGTFTPDYAFDKTKDGFNFPLKDFTFVGLTSLIDPPRESVPMAVAKCKDAGIKVIMVTGDHPITAKAIAQQVGIITGKTVEDLAKDEGVSKDDIDPRRADAIVIHGSSIKDFTTETWNSVLNHKQIVFARTSPQQKLVIVENNQRRKAVVAVTGDGVNDSPALKKADIGVAMGISGSDVSKEAADMILLDDNFASIVEGVQEGRLIFDNLKKSIAYTLTSNIPEISPFLSFIIFNIPLPLSTILILCVDLGTDMVPAISLAYEEAESDIMKRRPRNAETDHLVTAKLIGFAYLQIGMMQALAGFYTWLVVLGDYGFRPSSLPGLGRAWADEAIMIAGENAYYRDEALKRAQTAYFVSIVVVQWADLMICKTRKLSIFEQGMRNNKLTFGLFFETALAAILLYVPWLNILLSTRPIRFVHWLPGVPFSILIFVYDEIRKWIMRNDFAFSAWVTKRTYY